MPPSHFQLSLSRALDLQRFFRKHWPSLIVAFLVGLACYGTYAFQLVVEGDDWWRIFDPLPEMRHSIGGGRWMKGLLWFAFHHNQVAPSFALILSLVLASMGAILTTTAWGIRKQARVAVASSLILAHPTLAEHFVFPAHHIPIGFGFLLAGLAVQWARVGFVLFLRGKRQPWPLFLGLAILMTALASGTRQSLFLFIAVALTGRLLFSMLRPSGAAEAILSELKFYCATLASGFGAYFAIWKTTQFLTGIGDFGHPSRQMIPSMVSSWEQATANVERFLDHFVQFLFFEQHLWSQSTKGIFILFLVTFAWYGMRHFRGRTPSPLRTSARLAAVVAMILFLPWLIGLIWVPGMTYRYTALMGLTAVYPIIFLATLKVTEGRRMSGVLSVLSVWVLLSFAQHQSSAALGVKLRIQRDFFVIQRIYSRIEAHPQYATLSEKSVLFLVGSRTKDREDHPLFGEITRGPMATSRAGRQGLALHFPHKAKLMGPVHPKKVRTLHRKTFDQVHNRDRRRLLLSLAKSQDFPGSGSVNIVNGNAYVVFSKPQWLSRAIRRRLPPPLGQSTKPGNKRAAKRKQATGPRQRGPGPTGRG